jgi:hypothetical protein
LDGGNQALTMSTISTSDAGVPSLYLAAGENFFVHGNLISNGAGVAIQSAAGTTLLDGQNEVVGTVVRGGTRSTLAAEMNPFLPWLKGALPTISSASTIAPTTALAKISGTTTINTITAPAGYDGTVFCAIPTGLWASATGSNIAKATTAVPNQMVCWAYNSTDGLWYPSY